MSYNIFFSDLRKNHNLNLKFIGNKNKPTQIFTAKKAQEGRAEKIRRNLQHMREVAKAKKEAQNLYYGQHRSPMLKNRLQNPQRVQHNQQQQNRNQQNNQLRKQNQNQQRKFNNNKPSVQQRLNINNKQFVPIAKQQKLNRIQNYNNKRVQNNKNQNNQQTKQNKRLQNKNFGNPIRTVNPRTGEVKFLRPKKRNANQAKPQNFTVSVGNSPTKIQDINFGYQKHHVSTELNPMIQEEIRIIQNKGIQNFSAPQTFGISQVQNLTPDARVPISTTKTTLHERFSRM